ncbi:hypothetical protein [Micromonospora zamorensis]|uniref:hypothetical protein n=1 Tax=Micromonospora zamorensis TaxID=709883 RepID=UPI003CF677CE
MIAWPPHSRSLALAGLIRAAAVRLVVLLVDRHPDEWLKLDGRSDTRPGGHENRRRIVTTGS